MNFFFTRFAMLSSVDEKEREPSGKLRSISSGHRATNDSSSSSSMSHSKY